MRLVPVSVMVCVAAAMLSASSGPPADVGARAKGAGRVVVASVVDVHSTFGETPHGDQVILSHALLRVEEVLKGGTDSTVTVTVEGGTVGDVTLRVSDMPTLRAGERGVFFLDAAASGRTVPHRRGLGILKLDVNGRVSGTDLALSEIRGLVRAAAKGGSR